MTLDKLTRISEHRQRIGNVKCDRYIPVILHVADALAALINPNHLPKYAYRD